MNETLKNLSRILCLLFILVLASCKKSNDDVPTTNPPPDDETEMVPDVYLMVFNASQEAGEIDVVVESTLLQLDLRPSKNTSYYHFDSGDIEITVRESAGGSVIFTEQLSLEGGYLYSSYFYMDKEGNYDLILSKDFDDTRRLAPGSARVVNFTAIQLSKNIPYESIDIYNVEANRSTPLGDVGIANRVWINDLAYGTIQKNESASFGSVANHLIFASGTSQASNVPEDQRIEISNLPAITRTTNEGSNGGGPTISLLNTWPFESNIHYVFVAYNHATLAGESNGKILVLNSIPIVD